MTDEERATEYAVAYHTAVGRSIGDATVIPTQVDEAARREAREHVMRCENAERADE